LEILNKLLKPTRIRKIEAKIILKEPNCNGLKPISPFLMSINELPHTRESRIK
jgi:hypothetical protein